MAGWSTSHFSTTLTEEEKKYTEKLRMRMNEGFGFPHGATKVFDFLYLGGEDEALNLDLLSKLGITHVINCAAGYCTTGTQFYGDAVRRYVEFAAEDDDGYNIFQHFDDAHDAIEDARKTGGRALIHCLMGVNRSGALAVAYAMVHRKCGPISAAVFVRAKRKWLLSNEAFQEQLVAFARQQNLLHLDEHELTAAAEKSQKANKL